LPKETIAAESPNWASNLEPCDYQARQMPWQSATASSCMNCMGVAVGRYDNWSAG